MTDLVSPALSIPPVARPKPAPVHPVDARRVTAATGALAAAFLVVVWLARTLPHSGVIPTSAALVLGLTVLPVVASPIEWFVHRFVYHEAVIRPLKAIFTVHTAHHFAYFPTWRYVTSGPARRLPIRNRQPEAIFSGLRNGAVRLAHFAWYMSFGVVLIWLPAWSLTHNSAFLVGLVVASAVVSNLFIVVHDTIHRPGSHRVVEAQPWFRFLDRHHYIHHVALGVNLNFLLPLADLLFGTLRREMTADEVAAYGTLEQAKSVVVGQGERARLALALTSST